jgi:nicotinamidase-related amidase
VIAPLSRQRAALLVVDIQDRLLPAMPDDARAQVLRNTAILITAAGQLGLPIVVSQQYPKGLGVTAQPIEDALAHVTGVHRFDKLEFSAAAAPAFAQLAAPGSGLGRDQWIVCGMETHVCVYQTARDLVARSSEVHVCADAVCSRTAANREIGLGLMARAGATITSTEVCVFDLLGRAGSDEFRALSRVIK